MFGGCAMGEENVSQRKFEDFKEEIPQLALTLGDLRILERLVEDKRDILREFFGKVEPFVDRESLPIKKYFKDNVNQLKCLTSSLSSQELDYLVTDVDLQHAREIYAKSLRDPSASALQNNQKGIQIDS